MQKNSRKIYLLSPLAKEGCIHLPMIDFSLVGESLDLTRCDTLMFTSKEAVKSAELLNVEWKKIPSLAIGSATAKQIESMGGKVLYQPKSFYGESLTQDTLTLFKERKILYLRPKVVSFDAKNFLKNKGLEIEEQIIYETFCITYKKDNAPVKNAIIIFTSPSTIHCFLKNFAWDASYTAVVIGDATKVHLPENARYAVADKPLIEACLQKAKELSLISNSK